MALSAERYSATTPENISDANQNHYKKWATRSGYGRQLTLGEICCYTSHCQVLETFIQSESTWLLLLEDDIVLPPFFPDLLDEVLNIEEVHDGCVNLHKGCDRFLDGSQAIDLKTTHAKIGEAAIFPTSAGAIIWSKTAAYNFLKKKKSYKAL